MLDFIGIGARRSGEDWLYNRLRSHPEIHFPREMEIGFWSVHYPESLARADYARNLEWYRNVFGHWPHNEGDSLPRAPMRQTAIHQRNWFDALMGWLDRFDRTPMTKLIEPRPAELKPVRVHKLGDFSPTYCYFDDPSILPAIRDFAPDARVIYTVRHPMKRAWSAAQKLRNVAGLEPDEVSDQWYIDHFRSRPSLKSGNYARAIAEWQAVFPQKQLLVLRFEDIAQDPHTALKSCCAHIGVQDAEYFDATPARNLIGPSFTEADDFIRPSLLPALQELYAEKIEKLYTLTGIDYRNENHFFAADVKATSTPGLQNQQ